MKKFRHHQKSSFVLLITFLSSFFYWVFVATQNPNKTPSQQPTSNNQQSEVISGIARVIDGDTVDINKNRIRLIKIDAPESKQKCLDKNNFEYLCGEVSTAFLKKLISNKNVDCYYEQKDIYKRYLGDCKLGEMNINDEMVKNGMAIIYNLKEASEELKNLEAQAQNNKLGVWQGAFEEPKQYRKKHRWH
jgi:endonuclease YncB( thermonuclease family)